MEEYRNKLMLMTDAELAEEYRRLTRLRNAGLDRKEDLQPKFSTLTDVVDERKINIYAILNKQHKEETKEETELIETPNSSSIEGYSYNHLLKTLTVKFRSNDNMYIFNNVPEEKFNELQNAESKGSYIAKNIRGKYKSGEKKKLMRVGKHN